MKIFKEEQRFTQTWIILLIVITAIVPIAITFKEYFNQEKSISELITTLVIVLLSIGLIFLFKLKTRIDEIGVHYQFFPFHLKYRTKKWETINLIFTRKYEPISEYGGWGIHKSIFNKKKGTAINISGDIGIQLEFKSGKKLLIGTQKQDDVKRVLETYKNKLS